jgi:leucyl-tRNA synthetase
MTVPVDCDAEKIKTDAQMDEKIAAFIGGNKIQKVIYVPQKLVNIVVAP